MALPRKRIDCLSDDEGSEGGQKESEEDAPPPCGSCAADQEAALSSLMDSLKTTASPCAGRKRRRAKECHSSSNCTAEFLEPSFRDQPVQHRQAWMNLHKLDQDRLLFTVLAGRT